MIKPGTVVSLSYTLTDEGGEELDRAERNEPFSYLHGFGQIVPGLEKALEGLKMGATKKVVIPPEDGYGKIEANLKTKATRNQFPKEANLQVGMRFAAEVGPGQQVVFTVTEMNGEDVVLDGNHPLAGVTLTFDVEVLAVRDATDEEKQHGHAHGPEGHGHDHG